MPEPEKGFEVRFQNPEMSSPSVQKSIIDYGNIGSNGEEIELTYAESFRSSMGAQGFDDDLLMGAALLFCGASEPGSLQATGKFYP